MSAVGSSDPEDGTSLTYAWDWESDGTFDATGLTSTHTFASPGDYLVTLRVTDSDANTATATKLLTVVLATDLLVISTPNDEGDSGATPSSPGGAGFSLREAIIYSNDTAGKQVISFSAGMVAFVNINLPVIFDTADFIGVGKGSGVDGSGLGSNRNCLNIQGSNVRVMNVEIFGCPENAVQMQNGNNNSVLGCYLHDVGGGGIFTASSGGHVLSGNEIAGTSTFGISVNSGSTNVLRNDFHDNAAIGVDLAGGGANSKAIGNRIVGGTIGLRIAATGVSAAHNTVVLTSGNALTVTGSSLDLRNNIFARAGGFGISGNQGAFTQLAFNLVFSNGSGACSSCSLGSGSLTVDPLFVSEAGKDFRLSSGSPAIDAGVELGYDVNGTRVGSFDGVAPDMGYFEVP